MPVHAVLKIVLPLLLAPVFCTTPTYAATLSDWNVTTPLPAPLAAHAMVANATHVFVLGGATGTNCTVVDTVYVAPILGDGTLGEWNQTTPLTSPRVFLGAALVNRWLYVIGGASGCEGDGIRQYATVERAEIHPSGIIMGSWVPVASLTHGRSHMAVATDGLHIYAVGGVDGSVTNSVEMTTVSVYGDLAAWQTVAGMTVAREGLAAGIANGRLYAASGSGGLYTVPIPTTEGAAIHADGTLAAWQPMARLDDTHYQAAGAGLAGTLWITGGGLSYYRFNIPQQAVCDATGAITSWTPGPSLNVARTVHAAAVSGNRLYVSGGAMDAHPITSVEFAVARPAPPTPTAVGLYRAGTWYLDKNGNGAWDGCGTDGCLAWGGDAADKPVFGDWNGNGSTKIGVYRNGTWYLDTNGNGLWDGCGTDACLAWGGDATDVPLVGDWNGSGTTKIGVYRASTGTWYLDANGNGAWDGCTTDKCISWGGNPGDVPILGKW